MKRKLMEQMLSWKEKSAGKTALLIDGARRVGKSYIAEKFARENYKSYILIDFNRADEQVRTLFDQYLNDLDTLFMYLSAIYKVKLYPGESLIIFDEVQLCPRARAAVKYLVADGRYHYLETGSLLSIHENVADISNSIPWTSKNSCGRWMKRRCSALSGIISRKGSPWGKRSTERR